MLISSTLLNKRQLSEMKALSIFLACENFRKEPTSGKFILIMDETQDLICHQLNGEFNSLGKLIFDDLAKTAALCSDLNWKKFPIEGLELTVASLCQDYLPAPELRLTLCIKKAEISTERLVQMCFSHFIDDVDDWFKEKGHPIASIKAAREIGESNDN